MKVTKSQKKQKENKIIVLHSGGLDSTVCLFQALEKRYNVLSLGIDYGQRSRVELRYANNLCLRFNIERKVLKVKWDKPKRCIPMGRSIEDIRSGISPAFLPGRNALFLTLACAEAAGISASEVWIGINSIDYSGYPDCTSEFLNEFRKLIKIAIPDSADIIAPLIYKAKPEIAKEALRLGIRPGDIWSCYMPARTSKGFRPCGRCDGCILNKYAWDNISLYIEDKAD